MNFNSNIFIFFYLPLTLLFYYLAQDQYRKYILIIFSALFYLWSGLYNFKILLIIIFFNAIISFITNKNKNKLILFIGILGNLFILIYFKYLRYIFENINQYFQLDLPIINVIAPLGISFIFFHSISYLIDSYKQKDIKFNFIDFIFYLLYFPKIIQGPIVKYENFLNYYKKRSVNFDNFISGIEKFIIGLGKKVLIADILAVTVQNGLQSWQLYGIDQITAFLITICYFFQIYCDFSGYSDMAIGLSEMFGINLNNNFNYPYLSTSITEFWRRWHISLGSWFKEYVYIPLGGNRTGNVYINLTIVFLLTGLWHGVGPIYIIWGGIHGIVILIERILMNKSVFEKIPIILRRFYTLAIVAIGWLMFLLLHLSTFSSFIITLLGFTIPKYIPFEFIYYFDKRVILLLVLCIIFSFKIYPKTFEKRIYILNNTSTIFNTLKYCILITLFVLSLISIMSGTYSPFIYFQF